MEMAMRNDAGTDAIVGGVSFADAVDDVIEAAVSEADISVDTPEFTYRALDQEYIIPVMATAAIDLDKLLAEYEKLDVSDDRLVDAITQTVDGLGGRLKAGMTYQGKIATIKNIITRIKSGETNINTLWGTSKGLKKIAFEQNLEKNIEAVAVGVMTELCMRSIYDIPDHEDLPFEINFLNENAYLISKSPTVRAAITALSLPETVEAPAPNFIWGMGLVNVEGFDSPVIIPEYMRNRLSEALEDNAYDKWNKFVNDLLESYDKLTLNTNLPESVESQWRSMFADFVSEAQNYYFKHNY